MDKINSGLLEALEQSDALIVKAQGILNSYLPPDGISADEAISALLGLLDGPEQRAVQAATNEAIAKARGIE